MMIHVKSVDIGPLPRPESLSDADVAAICYETVRHLGLIPFHRGPKVSLWLLFVSRHGDCRTGSWRSARSALGRSM
jgi:hypothetical protein